MILFQSVNSYGKPVGKCTVGIASTSIHLKNNNCKLYCSNSGNIFAVVFIASISVYNISIFICFVENVYYTIFKT